MIRNIFVGVISILTVKESPCIYLVINNTMTLISKQPAATMIECLVYAHIDLKIKKTYFILYNNEY